MGLSSIALGASLLFSCATKPPSLPAKEAPAVGQASPAPVETPWYSAERRVAPPLGPILVIGLPEPAIVKTAIAPDLGQAIREAPAALALAVAAPALGEPSLPAKLQGAGEGVQDGAAAKLAAETAKAKAEAEAKAKAKAEAEAKAKSEAKKAAPHPAPAAPLVASVPQTTSPAAKVETVPSIPQSLVPIVDASAPPPPSPQRSFQVEVGGMASIPFVGTGWTYLGERDGKDGILYDSRRFEGAGALFTLLGSKLGEYNLRFLRQDLQNGTTTEELVHLSVLPKGSLLPSAGSQALSQGSLASAGAGSPPQGAVASQGPAAGSSASGSAPAPTAPAPTAPASQGGVLQSAQLASTQAAQVAQSAQALAGSLASKSASGAPGGSTSPAAPSVAATPASTSLVAPSAGAASLAAAPTPASPAGAEAPPAAGSSATASQVPPPAPGSPEAYLATARAEYAAGRAATTIAAAQSYLSLSPQGPAADEALWLEAQAYELNSSSRDVAKALGLYRQIVGAWPRSQFWSGANDRAAYIQRFYFDIR